VFERVVTKQVQGSEKGGVKCSEVKWSDAKWSEGALSEVMMILGELCVLS